MPIERKRGALSTVEMDYIKANSATMPVADIAVKLNRNEEPILKYITNNGLPSITSLVSADNQRVLLRNKLENRYYWPGIKSQLICNKTVNEIEVFANKWIDMFIQFKEDVMPTEEDEMKELIMLSITLDRIRVQETKNIQKIEELQTRLEAEYAKAAPDMNLIQQWENSLQMAMAASSATGTQIKTLNHDIAVLNKSLKVTRDQRFAKVESGEKTFIGLIRKLQNDEERREKAREAELMRIATEKKREKLYDYHKYGDGMIDVPILNTISAEMVKANELEIDKKERERTNNE